MIKSTKKRDVFDFELGYMVKSPCINCKDKKNIPKCFDNCPLLDQIRTILARGISSQASSYRSWTKKEHYLFEDSSNSYIKKHLSKDIFDILKKKKTKSGFTLYHAIKSGIENPDSSVGIYAGDKETYEEFFEIFNPVISDYHSFKLTNFHKSDFSVPDLSNPDPEKKYIISTRIRVARNLEKLPFTTITVSTSFLKVKY